MPPASPTLAPAPVAAPTAKRPARRKTPAAKKAGIQSLAKPLGRRDDLTRIKGAGPKMQEKLNALGVFHFWQIASLDPASARDLDGKLNALGRVERDDWVGQAKRLAEDVSA